MTGGTISSGLLAALAVLRWSADEARTRDVSRQEEVAFRVFNDAPEDLARGVWTLMQSGSLGAVPVVALMVGVRQGRIHGVVVAGAGTTSWLATKALKAVVGRGRPADVLSNVTVRGKPQSGLGYPSGHAAVALTLALTSTSGTVRRMVALVGAGGVAGGRLYTGAHLPLDVVGGMALGRIVGTLANRVAESATKRQA